MNERPTPESDSEEYDSSESIPGYVVGESGPAIMVVPSTLSRKLERQRDEAADALRYICDNPWDATAMAEYAHRALKSIA